jgi:hypothetical protein
MDSKSSGAPGGNGYNELEKGDTSVSQPTCKAQHVAECSQTDEIQLAQARNSIDITPSIPAKAQRTSPSAAVISELFATLRSCRTRGSDQVQWIADEAVPIWIALSSSVILYNKYLYSTMEYPYVSLAP